MRGREYAGEMKLHLKRVAGALILIMTVVIINPINSAQAFSGCPDTWNVNMPSLQVANDVYGQKRITFQGDDDYATQLNKYFSPTKYYPELANHISSLGKDVVWQWGIQISDETSFRASMLGNVDLLNNYYRFGGMAGVGVNGYFGIPLDPYLRIYLKIETKGCTAAEVTSPSIQFTQNIKLEDLDTFFSRKEAAYYYNFKQEQLLRDALINNYKELSKPELLNKLVSGGEYSWHTADDSILNPSGGYEVVGLSPWHCLKKFSYGRSAIVSFNILPCKIGVVLEEFESGGHLVQIMDFQAPPKAVATPSPTASSSPQVAADSVATQRVARLIASTMPDLQKKIDICLKLAPEVNLEYEKNPPKYGSVTPISVAQLLVNGMCGLLNRFASVEDVKGMIASNLPTGSTDSQISDYLAFRYSEAKRDLDLGSSTYANYMKKFQTTITCNKGKLVKKVTSTKPVCPKGYKKNQ